MNLFHVIDDAFVILRSKGVYRQAKLYRRGDEAYAQYGSGYIGLSKDGGTSVPNISWTDISALVRTDGPFGRLKLVDGER